MTTTEAPVAQAPLAGAPPPRRARRSKVIGLVAAVFGTVVLAVLVVSTVVSTVSREESGAASGGGVAEQSATGGAAEALAQPVAPSDDTGRAVAPGSDPARVATGPGRAVIRSAAVRVEVGDLASAAADVRAAVSAVGGYVSDERSAGGRSDLVVKVPAADLDAFLNRVGGLGTVTDRSSTARDVTDQLVDTDARVAGQRASVDRVRALLAQASSLSEIMSIESELTERQAALDSLERRLAALRASTDLATVDVALVPTGAPPATAPPPGFGAGLGTGWEWLRGIGSGLAAAVGFVLPLLPVVAVLVLLGWAVRGLRSRRSRARAGAAGAGAASAEPSGPGAGAG